MDDEIEKFLARLRDAHPSMPDIFKYGGCFELFRILRVLYPNAEAWYAWQQGHVYTKIGEYWYDIDGKHVKIIDKIAFKRMDDPGQVHRAFKWKKSFNKFVDAKSLQIVKDDC